MRACRNTRPAIRERAYFITSIKYRAALLRAVRAHARINWHFGARTVAPAALLGRADARRRDAGDVSVHRRGAATKQMPARRPAGFAARSHTTPGIARRSRLTSGLGGLQQNAK